MGGWSLWTPEMAYAELQFACLACFFLLKLLAFFVGSAPLKPSGFDNNNNNNRRLVTLAEHTSDHGRQTNASTEEKGEQGLIKAVKTYIHKVT